MPNGRELERIARLVDAGKLRLPIDHALPLAHAREAMQLVSRGQVHGKVVLTV